LPLWKHSGKSLESTAMNLRLHPLYKKLLLVLVVLGPIIWLVFTEDGRRRTDLVLLHLLGKAELDLAMEHLHSGVTEGQFRELFPDLALACDMGSNPFGDRRCTAEVGSFNAIPSRALTLFLRGDRLRATKLAYRPAYHEILKKQLEKRVGRPAREKSTGSGTEEGPLTWKVRDGLLLLSPEEPKSDEDAVLMWVSEAALRQQTPSGSAGP